jgi:aspartate 1-decarboxylase
VGDLVIILTYAQMEREELLRHTPIVVHVDENNRIQTSTLGANRGAKG